MIYYILALTMILLAIFMVSPRITEYKLKNISVTRRIYPDRITEGDKCAIEITIENRNRTSIPCIIVKEELPIGLDISGKYTEDSSRKIRCHISRYKINGMEKRTRRYTVNPLTRGTYIIKNLDISLGSAFGLSLKSDKIYCFQELIVYPEVKPLDKFKFDITNLQGDRTVRRWIFEDTSYIRGIRDYRFEDRMKDIHWKATLKAGKMMVKDYEFTSQEEMIFIASVDSMGSYYGENLLKAQLDLIIDLVVSVSWRASMEGINTGIWTNSQLIALDKIDNEVNPGISSYKHILEYCARMTSSTSTPFYNYIINNISKFNEVYNYIIAAYYIDDKTAELIKFLLRRGTKIKLLDLSEGKGIPNINGIEKIVYRGYQE